MNHTEPSWFWTLLKLPNKCAITQMSKTQLIYSGTVETLELCLFDNPAFGKSGVHKSLTENLTKPNWNVFRNTETLKTTEDSTDTPLTGEKSTLNSAADASSLQLKVSVCLRQTTSYDVYIHIAATNEKVPSWTAKWELFRYGHNDTHFQSFPQRHSSSLRAFHSTLHRKSLVNPAYCLTPAQLVKYCLTAAWL